MFYKKSREFIYRNARPLALALWKYHFENGNKEAVLEALSFYQNKDGGFGHAIEPDFWNPNSTPIGTWRATVHLASIGGVEKNHPMVQGILKYLDSGDGFDEKSGQWLFAVPSNNNYPHAIWWENDGKKQEFGPNPTAALAGFILAYADKDSSVYQKGYDAAVRCYQHMIEKFPITDMNSVPCYISLYHYCKQSGVTELFDMENFGKCLRQMVNGAICPETDKWGKEYVALPSIFINGPDSMFYAGNEELIKAECKLIKEQQLEDGSFTVPWQWWTEYKEFEVAKVWWKAEMIMEKLLYLHSFGELEEV